MQGGTVKITPNMLGSTSDDCVFTVAKVRDGRLQMYNNIVTSFSQMDLLAGVVEFAPNPWMQFSSPQQIDEGRAGFEFTILGPDNESELYFFPVAVLPRMQITLPQVRF